MFREFDAYGRFETPTMILQNPTGKELFNMTHVLQPKVTMRFIGYSDLSFTVPEFIDCRGYKIPYFEHLVQNRQVKVIGYGVFTITSVQDESDGVVRKKHITCNSLEQNFGTKSFINLEGTFPLHNPKPTGDPSILGFILNLFPDWKIESVDSELWYVYRTYNITEQNVYDAIFNTFSEDYNCVFTFNTFDKLIKVQTVENAVKHTDIYISFENLMKKININTVDNGIKTALEVYGADGLSIRDANPLGTATIYNFDYYKNTDWINQNTINAINAWETKCNNSQQTYANGLTELKNRNSELVMLRTQLTELETQKKTIDGVLASQIEQGGIDTTQKANESEAKRKEIIAKENEIKNKEVAIQQSKSYLNSINKALSFETNFIKEQLEELNSILITGTYSNDSFAASDSMTPNDIQEESQELLDLAKIVLQKESQPRYTFDLDCINILAIKELNTFANQMEMGCEMTIDLGDGKFFNPVLLEYPIEFDNLPNCKMTFCNNIRMSTDKFTFADMFKGVQSTVQSVSTNKGLWENFHKGGYKEDVKHLKDDAMDLANKEILSSTGQAPTMDATGIRGRKILQNGEYDPKQLWMINNMIAMTDSNWTKTPKVAIGELTWNGVKKYGVSSDMLIGNIILGENVVVKDKNGTFDIVGNLLTIRDRNSNTRVQLGEYRDNIFGLKMFSNTGNVVLDETGILQSWQDSMTDNCDSSFPLKIRIFIPSETKSVRKAILRFTLEKFRAYSTATGGGGSTSTSTNSGGGTSKSTNSGGGTSKSTNSGGGTSTTTGANEFDYRGEVHDHGIPNGTEIPVFSGSVEIDGKRVLEYNPYDRPVRFVASGEHDHNVNIESHSHDFDIPKHSHEFDVPKHSHEFDVPSHSHDFTLNNHEHDIKYGIYENNSNTPSSVQVYINGVKQYGVFYGEQNNINIAPFLTKGAWNTIELYPNRLGRISSSIFIQALLSTD